VPFVVYIYVVVILLKFFLAVVIMDFGFHCPCFTTIMKEVTCYSFPFSYYSELFVVKVCCLLGLIFWESLIFLHLYLFIFKW